MTNPDNVGGLPELPEPYQTVTIINHDASTRRTCGLHTDDSMRAYGELCRAAPAGGDEWPFVEEMDRDGKPTGYWVRKGSAAAARNTNPQDASGDAVKPLMAARETEDDGAAIMGRLARALAKADPSSKLPRRAIDWLRSKGIHWKSHCPTDPLHNFDEPLTGAGDNDDLPAFLEWVAGEVVRRDTRAGNFAEGLAQSLRGRAHILRIVKNDAMQAKEAK